MIRRARLLHAKPVKLASGTRRQLSGRARSASTRALLGSTIAAAAAHSRAHVRPVIKANLGVLQGMFAPALARTAALANSKTPRVAPCAKLAMTRKKGEKIFRKIKKLPRLD